MKPEKKETNTERPPVVVVMGHIDHGKSTLLDYIRKTNVVLGEAGGITQHISAYEVTHAHEGKEKKITFLDTPGHEAFSKMRSRGANAADIAILVVSAEDSVKSQTIEAWNTIIAAKIPYIVAVNKIDKPNANIEKAKNDLVEKGIYLEGMGGDIPFIPISAKAGTGIPELLDLILLVAELAALTGDASIPATGVIIESRIDPKRGITATMIVKNGTLKKGMFVVAGGAYAGMRMLENFLGAPIDSATFSSPVRLTGFDAVPDVGAFAQAYEKKKDAEAKALENKLDKQAREKKDPNGAAMDTERIIIPIVVKTDVAGTLEAVLHEIQKCEIPEVGFKIISSGVGAIGEADIKTGTADRESLILGFNVKMDATATDHNENAGVAVHLFDIIYKMSDFLKEEVARRKPLIETLVTTGTAKILKTFSKTKERQVIGGKVLDGAISTGASVRIMRRDFEIGRGTIIGLEQNKMKTKIVESPAECGILVAAKADIATGDVLEAFTMTAS